MWVKEGGLDVKAQEDIVRDTEALKHRLFQGIDKLKKVYTDIVKYEKKYQPAEAAKLLQEQLDAFLTEATNSLTKIGEEAKTHSAEALNLYKKEMGISEAPTEATDDAK